jgi:AcrR family transcriptional regulator
MPAGAAAERPGPGRPSTGARERILEAALEILKSDGYTGLTTARVAELAGQNKALISYHFGGKQGLVAEVAKGVAELITGRTREAIREARDGGELAAAIVDAVFGIIDEDEGIQRVYFDLISHSVVDERVGRIMADMKARFRAVLSERLAAIAPLQSPVDREAAAIFLIAGVEGLALERLERGETPALSGARGRWVEAAGSVLR